MNSLAIRLFVVGIFAASLPARAQDAPETHRLTLTPAMLQSQSVGADFSGWVDEQNLIGDPPTRAPQNGWKTTDQKGDGLPLAATFDLGRETPLATLWIFDTNNVGNTTIYAGAPGDWRAVATYDGQRYQSWMPVKLDVKTRYLKVEVEGGANSGELALYAYSDQSWADWNARKVAAALAAIEREQTLKKAAAEVALRPVTTLAPFGKLALVDEVDLGGAAPGHDFAESPARVSRIETILGRRARVLGETADQSAYMTVRIGRDKLLKAGGQYVLSVEYPEDAARTVIVRNGGDETTRGFHTGRAVGDALHPKYVNNLNESLNLPLSGQYRDWQSYFSLHDRFPDLNWPRGGGPRPLLPGDGFPVIIAQFSAPNDPASQGAAVARIRLYQVLQPETLAAPHQLPAGLPQRHLFWREEMADGVVDSANETERGVTNRLDWYRDKARLMHFLGMNTYSKDLLEFGAIQDWDSTPLGGQDWAFFNADHKDVWGQIVELMGREGFSILPYYEYAGSRGYNGLGHQKRARPLTRDDAYTHIDWIEASNADLTDPDTLADFKKMVDLTIVRQKNKANFVGLWLRPRGQLPMSFGEGALARFAVQANENKTVARQDLKADKALLARYESWWMEQRRAFLDATRAYLVESGINDPLVLFTATASEPGVNFADWDRRMVADDAPFWTPILSAPAQKGADDAATIISPTQIAAQGLYLQALLAPPLTWGDWEWNHGSPPPDPQTYKGDAGVLMTHGFNRAYTVASPATLEAFRNGNRLAMTRFYSLNENMMFDAQDKEKLGYFVADMELAGPYCMLAEARAMANGDPTDIGYLSGNSFQRGFPQYARAFNTAFLSLPALPSQIVPNAASDAEVVVRQIVTPRDGVWYALVNTGVSAKKAVKITLPRGGAITDAATGQSVGNGASVTADFGACELKAWRVR